MVVAGSLDAEVVRSEKGVAMEVSIFDRGDLGGREMASLAFTRPCLRRSWMVASRSGAPVEE